MVKTSGEHLSDLTILCGTKEIRTFQAQFWILVDSSGPLGTLAFRFLDIFNHEPVFLRGGIWLEITKKNIFSKSKTSHPSTWKYLGTLLPTLNFPPGAGSNYLTVPVNTELLQLGRK